ncbi:MAG: 23S rRNA (adenine(2503)-C(2))-methyltransferase RlmN [Phycisphaerales bacterium]|jgi:23S rRNA (adenine2503-C2)-methyltransferase|nr:23S rRNA (adenine(2503)-C(2))-methyltransferase RlmN [Phycisphaerales bacterium]
MSGFFEHTPESLREWCVNHGMPSFTAKQIFDWVYAKQVVDPALMSNLSANHRALLAEALPIDQGHLLADQHASDGTRKLLVGWKDSSAGLPVLHEGPSTETVLIPSDNRMTACVSSQIGCPVGCAFCASGIDGLEGNLSAGQIVEQVHRLSRLGLGRVTNVVFMGMGEPLANFAAVTNAITTLNASWGLGIGARKITVSTIGLPEAIRRLAEFPLPITLAISLHAPEDSLRRTLIPWAAHASIPEILDACRDYFDATGREITFEYLLLRGVNDRPHHARMLADLSSTVRCNINLIRYNEVPGLPFDRPSDVDVRIFQETLRDRRINAHIRASRGRDIAAACGQLRRAHTQADQST